MLWDSSINLAIEFLAPVLVRNRQPLQNEKLLQSCQFAAYDNFQHFTRGNDCIKRYFYNAATLQAQQRTFTVNHERNTFQLDGEDFQYVAGGFHYFRALPDVWAARMRTMKLAGLNVIDTYVEWSLHNPTDGIYNFEGMANITHFLDLAAAEGFLVILRPGPYICAERDNGGLPYWLFTKYPNIRPRTSDPDYIREVGIWYEKLMTQLEPYWYGNNGPIITVQVENEYASFYACDKEYMNWLADETEKYVQGKAVLFTTDGPYEDPDTLRCGTADGVFITIDFGGDEEFYVDRYWESLRAVQPTGPLVNSEFYPGWLTHWQENNQRVDTDEGVSTLNKILAQGASVSFYVFFGGTNFGFSAGANGWYTGHEPDITSYDYDAVMDEAGDPNGVKYEKYQAAITQFFNITAVRVDRAPKLKLPSVQLNPVGYLLSDKGRTHLGRDHWNGESTTISSQRPLSFEVMNQFSGFVLYETDLPILQWNPTQLVVNDLRDRALVYIDQEFVGVLSRGNEIFSLSVIPGLGTKLQILVENQGRINYFIADDFKGILGSVTISQRDGLPVELTNWTMTGYPLTNYEHISDFLEDPNRDTVHISKNGMLSEGPIIFHAEFEITNDEIYDTYLDVSGWGKGIAYVNGFNLGRYWPSAGPQITLYVPGSILLNGRNELVLIELERLSPRNNNYVRFSDIPIMDGSPDGNIGGNDGSNEDNSAVAKPAVPHILIVLATTFLIKNF